MFCGGTAVTSRLRGYVVIGALLGWTLVPLDAQQGRPFFYTEAGYVVASGDWKDSSGKPVDDTASSGHSIEIQCRQEIKECFEAKAMLVAGKPVASISNYRIIEWDKNSIVAEDDSAICVVGRLLITFQDRSVTAIDTPKKGAKGMPLGSGKNACELVNRTQTYTLVSRLGAAR
jgi:hypothetical protein